MGNSVACVSIIDSIMAGGTGVRETAFTAAGLRLAIPDGYLMADLDTEVATAFDAAIDRLRDAGVHVQKIRLEALEAMRPSNNIKSIVSAEAYRVHRQWLESDQSEKYDPFIERRLRGGADILAADYIDMFEKRDAVYHAIKMQTRGFDALVLPTTPGIAPAINDMPSIDRQIEMNARSLRNTAISNYLDRPTISIPCHKSGTAPVGLSLMGSRHHDRRLLAIAVGLETTIRG
jgi:aspartyl-tRNA(Asn)/glutamyl-tRNA(Gln) amidotransferase subunit A